jgi:hypothetical protein
MATSRYPFAVKTFWWIPRAGTWASAVALFVYALGVSFAFGAIMLAS